MYLAVFFTVVVYHLHVCVGYSPVPSLPTFGDIYYTTSDLSIRLKESWFDYGKLFSLYKRYNTSIHRLYAELTLAEEKCANKTKYLHEQVKDKNNLIELMKKEIEYLNNTILESYGLGKLDKKTINLKSALMVEEVIHSSLQSKIEEVKSRRLLQERSLLPSSGLKLDDYDTLYSQFLSILEYNHYLKKEIDLLQTIEKDYKVKLTKFNIDCEKSTAKLLIAVGVVKGLEKQLTENIGLLKHFVTKLQDKNYMDSILLVNKLNDLKAKNDVLKDKVSHLAKQTLREDNNLLSYPQEKSLFQET